MKHLRGICIDNFKQQQSHFKTSHMHNTQIITQRTWKISSGEPFIT